MNLPILYIQLSLPACRFKIGITGRGLMKRSRAIWKSTPGLQFPIFFVVTPFPAMVESALHRHFAAYRAPKQQGSGRTEWFKCGLFGIVLIEAIAIYAAIWVVQGLAAWWIVKKYLA